MLTHFDSTQFAASDRIASWRDAVARSLVDVECHMPRTVSFEGAFDTLTSGGMGLARLSASSHSATRSKASISRTGDDFFMLFLQRMGRMGVSVGERVYDVQPGDFFFYDARQPHCLSFDGQFDHIALKIPRKDVELRWRHLGARGCFRMTPSEPLSRIAASSLDAAAADVGRMSTDDLAIALENVVELFAAGSAKVLNGCSEGSERMLVAFARARAIIQASLHDDSFAPDTVASEMGLSRRSLNKIFEAQGIGVMEYIVLERLEHAARDLANKAHRSESVSEIAFRWGFKNVSHFSKRFHQHFGRAPSASRND
jgi:AraC family transcriptional regulator, positive regulator of tynA and feaB